jgi:hypothetical protein
MARPGRELALTVDDGDLVGFHDPNIALAL